MVPGLETYEERVPHNVHRLLDFLRGLGARTTFFTVGNVARAYPSLIGEIVSEGHEIGSHGREHLSLDRLDRASFRDDLAGCLEDLAKAGAEDVVGFRAPFGSLVARTQWAYEVLEELGFGYSSSVVATRNPMYGWPEFGSDRPRRVNGLWEIPASLSRTPGFAWPITGGVYLRASPIPMLRWFARRHMASGDALVSYLHPYDIDAEQERFLHPGINGNRLFNWLLYRNRDRVFERLEALMELGLEIVPYREFVACHLETNPAHG
jgi:polysaccharide deacetylase family protein (PEP-CTERM system associated)